MKLDKISDTEIAAYTLFNDALPYYWETPDKYPAMLKLRLALNGYGSAHAACVDIASHWITSRRLQREVNRALISVQTFPELA